MAARNIILSYLKAPGQPYDKNQNDMPMFRIGMAKGSPDERECSEAL